MFVYIRSEPGLYTVGHYSPGGTWHPDSDHSSRDEAAARVAYLNGGDVRAALRDIFEHCALIHRHWGEGDNTRQADAAIAAGRALLASSEG